MGRSRSRSSQQAHELELAYLPRRTSALTMRVALRSFLLDQALDTRAVQDVVLAAEEAFANAVVHGGPDGVILVRAAVEDGETRVEVRDLGRGFDPGAVDRQEPPDSERTCGRGLFLIGRIMDRVEIRSCGTGTTVQMVRHTA